MQLLGQPVRHNAFGTGVITGEYHYDRLCPGGKTVSVSGRIFPLSDPEGRRKAK